MKWSLSISNFLEEISSISHSILFLYFFALITDEVFLVSFCYSLELCIRMGISFLSSFVFPIFLKRSLVFAILFFLLVLCTVHWRRPYCLSLLFFETLHLVVYTFPFLPCFLLLFFLQLFIKPPQITTLPSCFSFSLGWFCLLPSIQCHGPRSIVLQVLCLSDLIPWICHFHCIIIRDLI